MDEPTTGRGETDQTDDTEFADIEQELSGSVREATIACMPTGRLEVIREAMDLRRTRAQTPRSTLERNIG